MDAQTRDKRRKDPSTPSAAHAVMAPRIKLINTLMEGTDALRAEGTTYLPRHPQETDENYSIRLESAVLVNYFKRTVESLVGKPFSQPVTLGDDMPEQLRQISEDIDRQGNSIDVFARKVFQDGLAKGLTAILVEFPQMPEAPTLEDERELGAAPYFVHIPVESIIAAYCEYRNGQEVLTHVRIYEQETVRDGFDEATIERIRILEPGTWQLWRKDGKKWIKESEGNTSLSYIPLIIYYTEREDFMVAKSPLYDLAHVNVAHWQSTADQRNILTVARFPMLAVSGVTDEESQVKVGPRQLLQCANKDGKFYYVEHTGAAIEAGRNDVKDMEEQMAVLGLELLTKSGDKTATAKAIDTAENVSMLQALVLMFSDALEQCYQIAADWLGLGRDAGGEVKINTDFGLSVNDASDLSALQSARSNGDISREAFLKELKRRNVLHAEYDAEEDLTLIEQENDKKMADEELRMEMQQKYSTNPVPVSE